jgi:hypothetical protein
MQNPDVPGSIGIFDWPKNKASLFIMLKEKNLVKNLSVFIDLRIRRKKNFA